VQVAVNEKGEVSIPRVDVAVDCGPQVNPERIVAQFEGACVMGVGNALLSEISFKAGRVVQSNFHDYQVARMNVAPRDIACTSSRRTSTCPWAASASRACRRSRRALCNAISPPPASASAPCRSPVSYPPEGRNRHACFVFRHRAWPGRAGRRMARRQRGFGSCRPSSAKL